MGEHLKFFTIPYDTYVRVMRVFGLRDLTYCSFKNGKSPSGSLLRYESYLSRVDKISKRSLLKNPVFESFVTML